MAEETPGVGIGRRMRTLREEGLMSRPELAERAGVHHITIDHIERGLVARPRRTTLDKIAAGLGVSAGDLIGAPQPVTPQVDFVTMSRLTEAERRRALGAATDDQAHEYRQAIDRAIDSAEGWRSEEQDQAALDAYIAWLHDLRAEADPFEGQPTTPGQRAGLATTHASMGA